MKTTKKLLSSLYIVALLSAASAGAATEDKPVTYGEKYSCEITTVDQKNYTLELEWHAEPSKSSTTPKWDEKFNYSLKENAVAVDSGIYTNAGIYYGGKAQLVFDYTKYAFSGSISVSTRVGTNYSEAQIELTKSYDQNAKPALAVATFKSYHSFEKFYGTTKDTAIELNIQSSTCAVVAPSKD